ncbi:MAG TPA: hypothetical protein EYH40_01560 [Desulfurococcales archaeon]|nr:hypothetical protein [Desulfurococcales archaeon]
MTKKLKIRPGIPLYGLPLKRGNNPFIILPYGKEVKVGVDIYRSGTLNIDFQINTSSLNNRVNTLLKEAYCKTLENILKFLDTKLKVKISIDIDFPYSPLYIYDTTIPVLLKTITTLVGISLSRRDIMVLLREFDTLKTGRELVGLRNAMRTYSLIRKPLIYREGEGHIILGLNNQKITSEIGNIVTVNYLPEYTIKYIENPLADLLIHLHGRLVIEAAQALRNGDLDKAKILYKCESIINLCFIDANIPISKSVVKPPKIVMDFKGITIMTLGIN